MTEHINTPELRFPEFKDIWYIKQLEEIGAFKNGINKDKNSFGHGFPFVNLNNVFSSDNINIDNLGLIDSTKKERDEYNLLKGDTLFIRSSVKPSGVGLTKVVQNNLTDTIYSGFLIRFREQKNFLEDNFKPYIFSSISTRRQIISLSSTSANTNINQDSLKKVKITIPTLREQAKIGNFFSKLDRQIELEEKKLELLEQQKKGYMQKIFSQELRFKDENGNEYPNWKNESLGDIAKITMGQSPSSKNYTEDSNYTILVQGNADLNNGYIKPRIYTKQVTKLAEVNDILLTVRAPVGKIGKAQLKACIGRGVCAIKGDNFIYYFLELFDLQNKWIKFVQGSTFESISGNEIKNIDIAYPSNEERQKISEFFSKLDELLKNQLLKVEQLKTRKNGLLQKMFV